MTLPRALLIAAIALVALCRAAGAQGVTTQCIVNVAAQGTGDAITSSPLPCGTTTNLVILTASAKNLTTQPTYQPIGSPPLPITLASGAAIPIGALQTGYVAFLTSTGSSWVLMNPAVGGGGGGGGGGAFDIIAYGAKCDGVSDDTTAIQAAIDAAGAAGGGDVTVPALTCMVQGTLNITVTGVSIRGVATAGSSSLLFANGSMDGIVVGNIGSQIQNNTVADLLLTGSAKTGGALLVFRYTAFSAALGLNIQNAYNGVEFFNTNTAVIANTNINAVVTGNTFGLEYHASTNGSWRADSLNVFNVVVQMLGSTGDAFLWDGAANDISAYHLVLLGARGYGLHETNSGNSPIYTPFYGYFYDMEVDGEYNEAVKMESPNFVTFQGGEIDSLFDTNPAHSIFEADWDPTALSRNLTLSGFQIGTGPGGLAKIDMQGVTITGSELFDGDKSACNTHPAVDFGSHSDDVVVVGNRIGFTVGQLCTNRYAVQVEAGASRVLLGTNNYRLYNGTGTVNNLAGGGAIMYAGGSVGYDGGVLYPVVTGAQESGQTLIHQLTNPFTAVNTAVTYSAATGTGGAFTSLSNVDGPTPIGVIATGGGDTGGLAISTVAGALNLNPTGGLLVNSVAGFSGTKTAGACTFTITKGIITGVGGC